MIFKKLLPFLKNKLFGSYFTDTAAIRIYCTSLSILDNHEDSLYIFDEFDMAGSIIDYNEEFQIIDSINELYIMDEISWEINDGC
jgi:hypothetical protein